MVSTASVWQLDELKFIATAGGLRRYSCFQCLLGESDRPRPTAFLTNFPFTSPLIIGPSQWPSYIFSQGKAIYNGPLKLPCGCGRWHKTLKRSPKDSNRTSRSKLLTPSTIYIIIKSAVNAALPNKFRHSDHLREGQQVVVADDSDLTDAPEEESRLRFKGAEKTNS